LSLKNPQINIELQGSIYALERKRILNKIVKFKKSNNFYNLTASNNSSLFSTIFSIFIKDLLNYKFEDEEKKILSNLIRSHQDSQSGLFVENQYTKTPNFFCKQCMQLTTFSMSALSILDSVPEFQINHNIKTKDDVFSYLDKVGVKKGLIGSGNFAMFLGIFLSYEKMLNPDNNLLKFWFQYHNEHFNKKNGFWTLGIKGNSQWSYQNGLHQLIIYEFWNEEFPNYKKAVNMVVKNADKTGSFSLIPGGGACWDYDAIHILNLLGLKNKFRKNKIESILLKSYKALINTKTDLGYCENSLIQELSVFKNIDYFIYNKSLLSTIFRLRAFFAEKNNGFIHHPHWSKRPIKMNETDLWSTWFRLITIAEIENIFLDSTDWNFHTFPGLGILKK